MKKVIFGFTGPIASGKGRATNYLEEKYGAARFRFSTILRDLLDRLYLPHTRETIPIMSAAVRKGFGEDILAHVMAKDIESAAAKMIVLDGIRREQDMRDLLKNPDFVFIYIDADERVRWLRIVKRGENADDATKTFDQFQKDEREIETEQTIPPLKRFAKHILDNSGTEQELIKQLDAIVKKYGDQG